VIHPVLVRFSALGIRVPADGSQLRVAPRSAITDEVRQLVRSHKDELLTALEAETRLRQLAAEVDLSVDELLRCYRDYAADIARLPANDLRGLIRGFATFRDYCRRAMARVH
jgi:acyl-CoA reductase-like NAD-dependent aldehyde dehydrogenase